MLPSVRPRLILFRNFVQKLTVEQIGHITRTNKGGERKTLRVNDGCCLTTSVAACAVADLVDGTVYSLRTVNEMNRCLSLATLLELWNVNLEW